MNRLMHAHLAKQLILACGKLSTAAEITGKSDSQLSRYTQIDGDQFMPADVIAKLEAFCGRPIYSARLADEISQTPQLNLEQDVIEANLASARLVSDAHIALKDDRLTPNERAALLNAVMKLQSEFSDLADWLSKSGGENITPIRKGETS